uniref:Uncharacterized protein n=1 Tax=Caenorhabditis japonica TaxID=281687 RepID=A0A8R1I958_CAEJA
MAYSGPLGLQKIADNVLISQPILSRRLLKCPQLFLFLNNAWATRPLIIKQNDNFPRDLADLPGQLVDSKSTRQQIMDKAAAEMRS